MIKNRISKKKTKHFKLVKIRKKTKQQKFKNLLTVIQKSSSDLWGWYWWWGKIKKKQLVHQHKEIKKIRVYCYLLGFRHSSCNTRHRCKPKKNKSEA